MLTIDQVFRTVQLSFVEREPLSLRMASKRFARLSHGFSKRLENHIAAVSSYVAHYNLCRVHEALRSTPAMTLGIADHVWSIGELLMPHSRRSRSHPFRAPRIVGDSLGN